MNEFERYLFDLQGFLVVNDVLNSDQLIELNHFLDQHIAPLDAPDKIHFRFDGMLAWGKVMRSLIDHPRITPYLLELLGENFRLDHDYAHVIRQGYGPIGAFLHGGGTPFDPCQYFLFQNGHMRNGLTAVLYNLTEVLPGEGGFGCVPGSHKSNFSLPQQWVDLEVPQHPCVQAIPVQAGSAIIFTEALSHGTLPWTGQRERRSLFFKYSPFPSAWLRHYYNADDYPDLTETQRRMLRSPGFYPH